MKQVFLFFMFLTIALGQERKIPIPAATSQQPTDITFKRGTIQTATAKELIPQMNIIDYKVSLIELDKINPEDPETELLKTQKTIKKLKNSPQIILEEENAKTAVVSPVILKGFAGNTYDGCAPPDNAIAYSPSSGVLVSASNCQIVYFNTNGQATYQKSLKAFFNNAYNVILYDPVIHYDPQINRFIMAILHGTTPATSKVLLCISKSSNPSNGWWVYELPGDPGGNNVWLDYPKLAVSDQEIFITGNQYDANGSFIQELIYQIEKTPAASGQPINYLYWQGLSGSPFTLLPVSGAAGNYGPGIYLVSVKSTTNKVNLYDITDYISNNPTINAQTISVSSPISIGGNALQKGTSTLLDAGDTRALGGFYHNGIIHFVHNNEYTSGYNGIMYHRINVNTLSDWSVVFGANGFDYTYPSVAWIGTTNTDQTAVINFLRSSSTTYPEHRVVICDNAGNFSSSVQVKAGNTFVNNDGNSTQIARWGDYTGITRDYTNNTVWIAGHYGTNQSIYNNVFSSWIAKIGRNDQTTNIAEQEIIKDIKIFPNPAPKYFKVKFQLEKTELVSINIYSVTGQHLQTLLQDYIKAGAKIFSFDTNALAPGEYFLQIKTPNKILKNEKIIIY